MASDWDYIFVLWETEDSNQHYKMFTDPYMKKNKEDVEQFITELYQKSYKAKEGERCCKIKEVIIVIGKTKDFKVETYKTAKSTSLCLEGD